MAAALDSGSSVRKGVQVQLLSSVPTCRCSYFFKEQHDHYCKTVG